MTDHNIDIHQGVPLQRITGCVQPENMWGKSGQGPNPCDNFVRVVPKLLLASTGFPTNDDDHWKNGMATKVSPFLLFDTPISEFSTLSWLPQKMGAMMAWNELEIGPSSTVDKPVFVPRAVKRSRSQPKSNTVTFAMNYQSLLSSFVPNPSIFVFRQPAWNANICWTRSGGSTEQCGFLTKRDEQQNNAKNDVRKHCLLSLLVFLLLSLLIPAMAAWLVIYNGKDVWLPITHPC